MLIDINSQEEEIDKKSFFTAKFIDPQAIIEQLDLKKEMIVADFGSGAGYFTLPIAKKIEDGGTVYALDVVSQKLESVASQAKARGLNNIITKRVNLENENGSGLDEESVDCVIMKDVLFQNKNKNQLMEEARRILKKGGKVLVIEWNCENFSIGPEKNLRIYKESVIELAKKDGLNFLREINAGNFHYGLILEK
jgi:ubiquinone/menaquinone biosynthesis C-methylase UbiE